MNAFTCVASAGSTAIPESLVKVIAPAQYLTLKEGQQGSQTIMPGSSEWLRDGESVRVRSWVEEQNAITLARLKQPSSHSQFQQFYKLALQVYQDRTRILGTWPAVDMLVDGWVYNLFQDGRHPRGLWRRTTVDSFRSSSPDWVPLVDIDAAAAAEREPLVYANELARSGFGSALFFGQHCLIGFGVGKDVQAYYREFDLSARQFVKDGFTLPRGTNAVWKDSDTLVVTAADNYKRSSTRVPVAKEWSRGQSLSDAKEILRDEESLGFEPLAISDERGRRRIVLMSAKHTGDVDYWLLDTDRAAYRMSLPALALLRGIYQDEWIALIRSDWTVGKQVFHAGDLVSIADSDIRQPVPLVKTILKSDASRSLFLVSVMPSGLLVEYADSSGIRLAKADLHKRSWRLSDIRTPGMGTTHVAIAAPNEKWAFLSYEDFLQPPTLYSLDSANMAIAAVRQAASHFDSSKYMTEELNAHTEDGGRVSYLVVRSRSFTPNGRALALVYAYGAGLSGTYPEYSGAIGKLWLDQGGVYVLARLRGGIVGAEWSSTDVRRRKTYEDLIAVAQDLFRRRITSSKHLGLRGHSLGGLLMAAVLNLKPEFFSAVVLENAVLDQLDESPGGPSFGLGNGDRALKEFLEKTSPLQNLRPRERFPEPLVTTNSNDGAVRPYWARQYAAKLQSLGLPCLFYELPEGNHLAHGSTPEQAALHDAIVFTYLSDRLM